MLWLARNHKDAVHWLKEHRLAHAGATHDGQVDTTLCTFLQSGHHIMTKCWHVFGIILQHGGGTGPPGREAGENEVRAVKEPGVLPVRERSLQTVGVSWKTVENRLENRYFLWKTVDLEL